VGCQSTYAQVYLVIMISFRMLTREGGLTVVQVPKRANSDKVDDGHEDEGATECDGQQLLVL